MPADPLPEGTDTIVEGAGVGVSDQADADAIDDAAVALTSSTPPPAAPAQPEPAAPASLAARVDGIKGQANDRARTLVSAAKDRATSSIDDIVRLIEDAAGEVDAKVGSGYGDHVRRAADGIAGLSDALKGKDVEDLFADARSLVARSPGIAIGAAAALGFVVARLARAGVAEAGAANAGAA